jgi:rubrerythrin
MRAKSPRAMVDELGALLDKLRPMQEREKRLKAALREHFEAEQADSEFYVEGRRYVARIGPKGEEIEILDMGRLYRLLKKERFLACCSFPVRSLKAEVSPAVLARLVRRQRTGPRKVEVEPREAA